jgi:hypothetical protein
LSAAYARCVPRSVLRAGSGAAPRKRAEATALGALSAELEGRGLTNRGDANGAPKGAGRSLERGSGPRSFWLFALITYSRLRKWTLRKRNPWLLAELHALDPEWASFIANFDQADGSTPLPSRRGQWPYDLCADPRRADPGCLDGETQRGAQGESPGPTRSPRQTDAGEVTPTSDRASGRRHSEPSCPRRG